MGTYNLNSKCKQVNINAPKAGTICDDSVMARPRTERRRQALLAAAQRSIRGRYSEFDLRLADVAEEVGCSPRQLQRVFAELAAEDFRGYLLRMRMERARQLLSRKTRGFTVRDAARAVGYREASGLRQAFLRFYGQKPYEFQPKPPEYPADVFGS